MINNRIEILIHIRDVIQLILTGSGTLGRYEVLTNNAVVGEIPSIQIRYPMKPQVVNLRMKRNSGVEVTIESEPRMTNKPVKFGYNISRYYQVIIDEYRETGGLTDSVTAIIGSNAFDIPESPIIREGIVTKEGVEPPRAILAIRRVNNMPNLFFS